MNKRIWESILNVELSNQLNIGGVVSRPEHLSKEGRQDVLIHHQGLTIVLEGSYDRSDAEKDARLRIEQLAAEIAIAIHYPSSFLQELSPHEIRKKLHEETFFAKVIVPDDISGTLFEILHAKESVSRTVGDWIEVDLSVLVSLITEVAQLIIDEELLKHIEGSVEILVDKLVRTFTGRSDSNKIAENIYNELYKLYGFSIGDPKQIKEPLFAQAVLAVLLGAVYHESIRHVDKLDSLRELSAKLGAKRGLEEGVEQILHVNYPWIFDLVKELLKSLPPEENAFKELIDLAGEISTKRALLRRDLGGKVYHKVVGSWALRKGLATYYTQVPSAYLLLYLARPKIGKVADFACGSGTLLVAAYSALNSQHRLELWKRGEDKSPRDIERDFHIAFVKNCYAFDVLRYALQITILNLALHSPETPIHELLPSRVIPLGYSEKDDLLSLGSLELGRSSPRLEKIDGVAEAMGVGSTKTVPLAQIVQSGPFDLIVMNPPFSRTTGRGGKKGGGLFGFMENVKERSLIKKDYMRLSREFRRSMLRTAEKLLKKSPLTPILKDNEFKQYGQIWQAGVGLMFLYLADKECSKEGKICFVLPRSLLSGVSWFLARTLLAAHYHIEYVIVSYDSKEYNFSESTNFAECMVIAQKNEKHDESETTKFIMLLRKPSTSIEAIALADALSSEAGNLIEAAKARALVRPIARKSIIENCDNWGRFVFLPELEILDQIENLLRGKIKIGHLECNVPMTKLNELILTLGPDRKRFGDTFKKLEQFVPGSIPMVKGGEEERRLCMATSPNAFALPLNQQGREMFEDKGGTLLLPNRIRITTAHVIALRSDIKSIANIFYVARLKSDSAEKEKALCLWLNTTWGIVTVLANRQDTHGGFIDVNMAHWRMQPVPDLDALSPNKITALAEIFDQYKNRGLRRIPGQYNVTQRADQNRYEIDKAFLSVFGQNIDDAELKRLYRPLGEAIIQWVGK